MAKKKKRKGASTKPTLAARPTKASPRGVRAPGSQRGQKGERNQQRRGHDAREYSGNAFQHVEADQAGSEDPKMLVVGIGASAGGLEAISKIFSGLSEETGAAFVIIQHLSPNHHTAMPELLKRKTAIPFVEATEGAELEPNKAFLIPPDRVMRLEETRLALYQRSAEAGSFTPISQFFHSMAEDPLIRPIAVVLSGSSSDGADALPQVKAAGGITIAQDPATTQFNAMPTAAIQSGAVDLVLSPEAIAAEINRITGHPYIKAAAAHSANIPPISSNHYRAIFEILSQSSGIDFSLYKQPTIRRRLQRRMVLQRVENVDRYIELLRAQPGEADHLYQDLLIHVTSFFREPQAFDALCKHVFPALVERRDGNGELPTDRRNGEPTIRLWVPGCSTGEEAYSLAIELTEYLAETKKVIPFQIFATDVSESAVEQARAGVYADRIVEPIPPDRLRKYFTKTDGRYRVSRTIRDACIFARQDLTRDPPFSKLDLIVCRNVLIYLAQPLQRRLLSIFHYGLKHGGFLLLGHSETTAPATELFHAVDRQAKIYQRRPVETFPHLPMYLQHPRSTINEYRPHARDSRSAYTLQSEITRVMLERYAPPGVVVDADGQIIQFRGKTGMFLEPPAGDASLNLLKMAREGLLHGLRSAMHQARTSKEPVRKEGLQVRSNGGFHVVSVQVVPLTGERLEHYLVLFEKAAMPAEVVLRQRDGKRAGKSGPKARDDSASVTHLQRELNSSREYLQSIIQDLEAANEELQSANEEILSSNEELQSTNEELDTAREELQSTNEELNTLNDELHSRNDELSRANSDLVNLLASVQIAIVMVSSDRRIRRFTPMAEKVLNILPTDTGRPISHLKPNIDCPDLEDLIGQVVDEVATIEREVPDSSGRWWSLRIRPYKDLENRIDGAILALFDVHEAKVHEFEREQALDCATSILDTMNRSMAVVGQDLKIQAVSRAFCEMFGFSRDELYLRPLQVLSREWDTHSLVDPLQELLKDHTALRELEIARTSARGEPRRLLLQARKVNGAATGSALVLLSVEDHGDNPGQGPEANV